MASHAQNSLNEYPHQFMSSNPYNNIISSTMFDYQSMRSSFSSQDYCQMNYANNINLSSTLPPPPEFEPRHQQQHESFVQQSMGFGMGFNGYERDCDFDLDYYLHLQGEKLRQMLQEQRKQELRIVLSTFQSKAMTLLKQREDDVEKQRIKANILEQELKKAIQELEKWKNVAKEKQEMVMGLNNLLHQVKSNLNLEDDAESVCEYINGVSSLECKCCNLRDSCVVLLPCKHLSSCKSCDVLLTSCPLCHCVKQGSIEIFLS